MRGFARGFSTRGTSGLCLAAAILFAVAHSARAQCPADPAAEAPFRLVEGFPLVTARIGASPVSMVLDTGAGGNLLLPEAAAALGLRPLAGLTVPMFGTGGTRDAPVAILAGLQLGGLPLPPIATPIARLPPLPTTEPAIAGLIGAPLLMAYDVDLDVRQGRIRLYPPGACRPPAGLLPMPLEVTADREAFLAVQVDGHPLLALLDTGSRATLLTTAAARRLGIHAPISANTARGVDGERLSLEHARVREMQVGADLRTDVPVSVSPLQAGRADMLLGMDYLGQRRVWISYASGLLAIGAPTPDASPR